MLLGLLSLGGLAGILFVATHMSERMGRLSAFMDPERFKDDAGLQQMQALIAWGSGGMEGLGLGNGRQKMLYLPYAHTDFIFPMIGEELGLRVSLLVVFLFVVIIVCGMMIALHAKDRVGLLARLRDRLAARLAGGGQHRRHDFAPAEQRFAAAVCELRRIEPGRVPFRDRIAAEHLSAGSARAGEQETDGDPGADDAENMRR